MSILQAVRTFMLDFPLLDDDSPLFSDHETGTNVQYSVLQLPGNKVQTEDLTGNQDCQFTFAFQSVLSTLDELQRYENADFYEQLEVWFRTQSEQNNLPTLLSGQRPEKIETLGWGYLMQEESGTGVYQVQCRLLYNQET